MGRLDGAADLRDQPLHGRVDGLLLYADTPWPFEKLDKWLRQATAAGSLEGMEPRPHQAAQAHRARHPSGRRAQMGVLAQGLLAHLELPNPPPRAADRLLDRPGPGGVPRTLPPFPGRQANRRMRTRTSGGVGGAGGKPGAYPIPKLRLAPPWTWTLFTTSSTPSWASGQASAGGRQANAGEDAHLGEDRGGRWVLGENPLSSWSGYSRRSQRDQPGVLVVAPVSGSCLTGLIRDAAPCAVREDDPRLDQWIVRPAWRCPSVIAPRRAGFLERVGRYPTCLDLLASTRPRTAPMSEIDCP